MKSAVTVMLGRVIFSALHHWTYFEIRVLFSKFKIEVGDLGSNRSHSRLHHSRPLAAPPNRLLLLYSKFLPIFLKMAKNIRNV